jgi:hypothetical protein
VKVEIDCQHPGEHRHFTGMYPAEYRQMSRIAERLVLRSEEKGFFRRIQSVKFQSDTIGNMLTRREAVYVTVVVAVDEDQPRDNVQPRERETKAFEFIIDSEEDRAYRSPKYGNQFAEEMLTAIAKEVAAIRRARKTPSKKTKNKARS